MKKNIAFVLGVLLFTGLCQNAFGSETGDESITHNDFSYRLQIVNNNLKLAFIFCPEICMGKAFNRLDSNNRVLIVEAIPFPISKNIKSNIAEINLDELKRILALWLLQIKNSAENPPYHMPEHEQYSWCSIL